MCIFYVFILIQNSKPAERSSKCTFLGNVYAVHHNIWGLNICADFDLRDSKKIENMKKN